MKTHHARRLRTFFLRVDLVLSFCFCGWKVMCGDCKVDPLQSAVMTLVTCRGILRCTLRTEPKGKYWKAVMSSRYPTPFFWEVLKRSFLHPSSLWATELYKQQDSIGVTWINVAYNEFDPHELCVQSWLALLWGVAGISCPMVFSWFFYFGSPVMMLKN